ncbi:unnamed protein product [Urochloa humidicola]
MNRFLATTSLLLCLLNHGTSADIVTAWDDRDFFRVCPPTRCSKDGPEIRFPLRLESSNSSPSCGAATCTKLACSGQDTILQHPFLGPSKVIDLNYNNSLMKILPLVEKQFSECPIRQLKLPAPADVENSCFLQLFETGKLVGCSREFTPSDGAPQFQTLSCTLNYGASDTKYTADYIAGPIPCHSNPGRFTYLVNSCLLMSVLPLDCKVFSNALVPIFPIPLEDTQTFKQRAEAIIRFSDITTSWNQWNWTFFFRDRAIARISLRGKKGVQTAAPGHQGVTRSRGQQPEKDYTLSNGRPKTETKAWPKGSL